jgi:hypothetical protein
MHAMRLHVKCLSLGQRSSDSQIIYSYGRVLKYYPVDYKKCAKFACNLVGSRELLQYYGSMQQVL